MLKLFGKKKKKADDEDETSEPEPEEREAEAADDEPGESGDDDGKGKGKRKKLAGLLTDRKKLIAIAAAGAVLVLGGVGGGGWWFFYGGKSKPAPEASAATGSPAPGGALTPPSVGAAKGPTGTAAKSAPGAIPGGASLNAMATPQAAGTVMVPAATPAAFARIPERAPEQPLPNAPEPALTEQRPEGPLPKMARDGRKPMQAYARPAPKDDGKPRIALILAGMGLSRAESIEAMRRLPGAVTLAFDAYAKGLTEWGVRARQSGHETLLVMPMELVGFPVRDAGPVAMMVSLKGPDNVKRMESVLARMAGYVGIMAPTQAHFTTLEEPVKPVLEAVKARGLMFVDGAGQPKSVAAKLARDIGLPRALIDATIDADPSRTAIDAKLSELETVARGNAVAVGLAYPLPVTVERLAAWIATLESKGFALVPVSAVADRQIR